MTYVPNEYLKGDPVEQIRCQQHAARIFSDDSFRLLPKNKFLFHVAFNINWPALSLKNINIATLHTLKEEINLLVKSVDLPAYTVQHDVLNQYNRKKVAQYQHKYSDAQLAFHDDNMGLINQLWQAYYKYYYNDPNATLVKGAYNKNATRKSSFITSPYGYAGQIKPFFNYIIIYQMARHEYVSYKLINPVITSWTGGKIDYAQNAAHAFDMKLAYEAVSYDTGYVDNGQMEGFGAVHYDWTLSPITSDYPRNVSTTPSFTRTSSLTTSESVVAATPVTTKKTASTKAVNPAIYQTVISSSNQGIAIPQATDNTDTTVATQVSAGAGDLTTTTSGETPPEYTAGI